MQKGLVGFVLALLIALAGCGSGSGAGHIDPATLAPPGALAYATLNIAPQGGEKTDFDAAFGKLLGGAPELRLGEAFTRFAQTSGKLDYLNDVKPWLGDSLTLVVTHVERENSQFALLAASTDDDKAQAAIDKDLAGRGAQARNYRDVDYKLLSDGTANGVVGHFLVAGTEATFKQVVDTLKDGKSLAETDAWKQTVGDRGAGKSGLAYLDAKGLLQSAASGLPGAQRVAVPLLLGMLQLNPFVATLDATPDSLVIDTASPGTKVDTRGPSAASSPLIESLPASSWLALAVPDVGPALGQLVGALQPNPLIAGAVESVRVAVKAKTGLDLQRDVIDSVGDVAAFALGTTKRTAGAGVLVQTKRPAVLAAALGRLQALMPAKRHAALRVTTSSNRVAAGHGAAALAAALDPAAKLGATPLFKKAAVAVGRRPTLFVDFGKAMTLAANAPHHKNDAHFKRALPRLRHVEYVAAGARRDAGLDVIRTVIGVR
jgi:hypothetical protein